jgi:hypothetical protein
MLVIQEESEAAGFDLQAALDKMESLKKMLDNEVERWYGKYRAKMVALSEMSETLQEVRAGREIARGQAKIWEVKKEYVEDRAAESSTMAEQLAAANERVRLLEIESQEAIAQLGETVELKKKLEESLVRVAKLEAQLSGRSAEEGGGDVGRERERERGDRETTQTPIPTQQAPTSAEAESEQATLIKSQADIIAQRESTLRRIMADIKRELHPDSDATIDSTHAIDASSERAASQHPTADISLLDNIPQQQLDTNTSDPAVSKSQESRESLLANMTIIDVYNVLRKQSGPNACRETTAVHDSGPVMTDGVEGGNVGAEGPRGGFMINGYPVRGIPGFSKHTFEPTPIQVAAMVDLQSDYAQLQQRHDDLQKQHNAVLVCEEGIRKDNHETHLHYLGLLEATSERLMRMRQAGHELSKEISDRQSDDKVIVLLVQRSEMIFYSYCEGVYEGLLESTQIEAKDLSRKHLFHHERTKDRSQQIVAECNRVKGKTFLVRYMPSRRDQTIFPATWAWLDQEFEKSLSSNTTMNLSTDSLNIILSLKCSTHGKWPEVRLTAFSWALYKVLDSVWEDETSSKGMEVPEIRSALEIFMIVAIAGCGFPWAMRDRYRIIRQHPI